MKENWYLGTIDWTEQYIIHILYTVYSLHSIFMSHLSFDNIYERTSDKYS